MKVGVRRGRETCHHQLIDRLRETERRWSIHEIRIGHNKKEYLENKKCSWQLKIWKQKWQIQINEKEDKFKKSSKRVKQEQILG